MSSLYIFVIIGLLGAIVGFRTNVWGMVILNMLFVITLVIIWPVLSATNTQAVTASKSIAFVGIAATLCVPMTVGYLAQLMMGKSE